MFNVSSYQSLFIDRRDVVIRTEECRLVLVNIKCESEYYKGERIDAKRIILYDSITVIVSPITIYNNSLLTFHLIVGNSNGKVLRINPGERLEINKFSAETKL